MGNFVGSCSKKEYDIQIVQLSAYLKASNKTLQQTQNKNRELTDEIRLLNEQVDILEKKALKLSSGLKYYDEILGSASLIADSIIESDLNCKWMDDDKEREYISGIVKFIQSACNDKTCSFNLSKKHIKNRSKIKTIQNLKKLDTIDKRMIDIEQIQFYNSISPISLP
jgi:hypothetical protein